MQINSVKMKCLVLKIIFFTFRSSCTRLFCKHLIIFVYRQWTTYATGFFLLFLNHLAANFANENMKCELLLSRVLYIYGNHVAYKFYNDRHQLYNKSFSGKNWQRNELDFLFPALLNRCFVFVSHIHTPIDHDELTFSKHLAVMLVS